MLARLQRALTAGVSIMLKGHYDAAQPGKQEQRHWRRARQADRHPSILNTQPTRAALRRNARYEFDNNSYMQGMIENLNMDTLGSTYPRLQVVTDDASLNKMVEECWGEWCESYEVNWPGKLKVLNADKLIEGESFLNCFTDFEVEAKTGVSLNVDTIEARRVTDWNYQNGWLQNGVYNDDGVVIDVYTKRPVAFLINSVQDDLLSGGASMVPITVSAEHMYQWYTPNRSSQFRGVSEVKAALPLFGYLRRFTLATVNAAEFAASFAGVLETNDPAIEAAAMDDWSEFEVKRGILATLPEGRKMNQFKAEHPVQSYEMFTNMILREIGATLSIPFGVVANDMSKYNFASGRLDIQSYIERLNGNRQQLNIRTSNRVHEKWIFEFALRLIYSPDPAFQPMGVKLLNLIQSNKYRYQWRYYNRPSSNPVDDATANEKNLLNGLTTLSDIYGGRGENYEEKMQQRKRELGLTEQNGFKLPWSTPATSTPTPVPINAAITTFA